MRFRIAAMVGILSMASLSGQAVAAQNDNACGAVLCLAGQAMGKGGGSSCSGYLAQYFSIVRFHHGHFDASGTSSARMSFLNECSTADDQSKKSANDRYGAQQFGP